MKLNDSSHSLLLTINFSQVRFLVVISSVAVNRSCRINVGLLKLRENINFSFKNHCVFVKLNQQTLNPAEDDHTHGQTAE